MLVPLSWLRDFAPFDLDPAALGEVFDDLGMVVEAINRVGAGLEDVIVAHVVSIDPIDGADKIRRILVDAGDPEPRQIVCGAWNFGVGDSVPLAPVGAVLPGDFAIGRRKMKGVESNGMLCSARELGLGEDAAGLLVLTDPPAPGTPIRDALGIEADIVYDLAIEANRPDANCIAGVARDAAARLGLPFAIPPVPQPEAGGGAAFELRVTAPDLCDRFLATCFDGVVVGPSARSVASRLALAGMRPISNVVDASNYVMLELGQPTHAYDLDRLPSPVLGARAARAGEELVTLDDVRRVLGGGTHPDAVIVDGDDQVIGIAGIMGGASSEVHDGTTRVVLEAAHFTPMAIARTSKRLGLRSEASARFERGADVEGLERASRRFADLLGQTSSGLRPAGAATEFRAPSAGANPPIRVRVDRVNAILGTCIERARIVALLEPIGFSASPDGADLVVAPPSFRPDALAEIDVVEEVARHHGYANVARTTPRPSQVGRLTPYQRDRRLAREILSGAGLSEAAVGPLLGPGDHPRAGLPESTIVASDPLIREESVLRASLRPGLLRAVAFNRDRRTADVRLFEIGHVWPGGGSVPTEHASSAVPGTGLPDEREVVGAIVAGAGADATGAVQLLRRLAAGLRVPISLSAGSTPGLHPTRTASVVAGGAAIGWVGEIDPSVVSAWGLDGRVGWFEVELPALLTARQPAERARPVSRFPSSDLDLAFAVASGEPAGAVEATLRQAGGELLESVVLFDVYRGPGLTEGTRSLAYRLRFVAQDHTLTDGELGELRANCIAAVEARHPAKLR
jgi:phenylalanyl-tRNA synthetase beta chain